MRHLNSFHTYRVKKSFFHETKMGEGKEKEEEEEEQEQEQEQEQE